MLFLGISRDYSTAFVIYSPSMFPQQERSHCVMTWWGVIVQSWTPYSHVTLAWQTMLAGLWHLTVTDCVLMCDWSLFSVTVSPQTNLSSPRPPPFLSPPLPNLQLSGPASQLSALSPFPPHHICTVWLWLWIHRAMSSKLVPPLCLTNTMTQDTPSQGQALGTKVTLASLTGSFAEWTLLNSPN